MATAEQKKGIVITVVSIAAVITLFMGLFLNKMLSPRILSNEELQVNGAIVFENPRIVEEFTLKDQYGEVFDLSRLEDKWTLIYLGFTHCPDICPTTLSQLNRLMDMLSEDEKQHIQVAMLSADSARDTPEILQNYINYFNPSFIGITGDFVQTMKLAQNLNATFNKVVMGDSYTIDHTGNLILINPNGHYHGFFKSPFEPSRMKLTILSIMQSAALQ